METKRVKTKTNIIAGKKIGTKKEIRTEKVEMKKTRRTKRKKTNTRTKKGNKKKRRGG